jgi:hypothetical protein
LGWKTLGKQAKAVAVEPQQLDDVTAASAENEDVAGERLLLKHRLHLRTETLEAAPHIGHPGGDPYPRSGAQFDHLCKLSKIDRNRTGSAPLSTLIVALPGNSMWIELDVAGCCCAEGFRIAASHGADTVTGSRAVDTAAGSTNSPRSKARRHLNT